MSDIQVFGTQLKAYQSMNGSLPTTERGLQALVEKELLGLIPQDPWNTSYIYRCPGKKHAPTATTFFLRDQISSQTRQTTIGVNRREPCRSFPHTRPQSSHKPSKPSIPANALPVPESAHLPL